MMLFQIRDLTKVYGDRTVLDIPRLDFEKGIIYSLLGPNGSGKTTLLEILSLLSPPTTGKVRYNNIEIDFSGNNLSSLRREIVMVQQNPVLFTTTVYKNLEFGLKIRGISKGERTKIIEESLDMVGMRDFVWAEAHKLSGGETQRVAIARALACSPKVIFFDEPTANVDVENQGAIERIITEVNTQKEISVIFTTHNLIQASRLSQNILSLYEGRVTPSVFENIFSGKILFNEDGGKSCHIYGRIRLLVKTEKMGNVRISVDPLKVILLGEEKIPDEKNLFKGRIIQLTEEHKKVRATVDIGIPLNALLSKDEVKRKGLYVGDTISVLFPKEAIQVF